MNIFLTTIAAILIFAVMILIHEAGHFVVAKLSGVRVNEFALGMGPKLFGKKWGETLYSVRLFPIGGYCALEGEDTASSTDERSFSRKKPLVRFLILAAGAFMNLLLGYILIFSLTIGTPSVVVPQVEEISIGSAAESAGLTPGDKIIRANGKRVHIIEDLSWTMSNNKETDKKLELLVENSGKERTVSMIPDVENGKAVYGMKLMTEKPGFFSALRNSWHKTFFYSRVIVESFVDIIRGKVSLSQVSGPVGIVSEIGTMVEQTRQTGWEGFRNLLSLTILLTVNLGIFNLLPLPALDGGRILFVIVEMIRRKPIPVEKESLVHLIGFVLLILLSVLITFKDVFTLWG